MIALMMTGAVASSVANVGSQEREQFGQSLFGLVGDTQERPRVEASGGWRIQIGTFRSRDSAVARLEATARNVPELATAGIEPSPHGALTRARFVGLPDAASARAMCNKIVANGGSCFVLPPG